METLNMKIPIDLHEALRTRAFEEKRSQAELVRRAIRAYLLGTPDDPEGEVDPLETINDLPELAGVIG